MDEDTIAVRSGEQLDWAKVEQLLRARVPGIGAGAREVRQFPSGASNLTYLIRVGEWEGVCVVHHLDLWPPKHTICGAKAAC